MKFFGVEIREDLPGEEPLVQLAGVIEDIVPLLAEAWKAADEEQGPERYRKSFARLRAASAILNRHFGTEPDCDDGVGVSIERIKDECFDLIMQLAKYSKRMSEMAERGATDEEVEKLTEILGRELKSTQLQVSRLFNSWTYRQQIRYQRVLRGEPETDPLAN